MRARRRSLAGRVGIAGAFALGILMFLPQTAYAAGRTAPLGVVARDFQFQGVPRTLPAGQYNVRFFNIGHAPHVLVAANLGPECSQSITTNQQAVAFLATIQSEQDFAAACPGGTLAGDVFAPPGGRSSALFNLAPGRTLVFCPIPEENGTPHFDLGMVGLINVFTLPGR